MTKKCIEILDPDRLIAKQGVLAGSEEHKELMKKTICMVQNGGNLSLTTNEKDGFDVGEIKAKTRNAWDLKKLTIYECQTNAIKSEVDKAIVKSKRMNAELVFVVGSKELAEEIDKSTENQHASLVV